MSKTRRVLHVAVALLLVVCMVIGCTAGAYAEVITLVAFSAAVVVSAVLTACGLIMTQGNSPEAWENLCKTVAEVAQLPSTLSLALIGGLTYLDAAIINAIVQAANQQQAFEPVANQQWATVGDYAFPYIGEQKLSGFLDDRKMRPLVGYFNFVEVPSVAYPFEDYSISINDRISVHFSVPQANYYQWGYYLDDVYLYGVGSLTSGVSSSTLGAQKFSDVVIFKYGSLYCYLVAYYYYSTNSYYGNFVQIKGDAPSISAEFPWELDPDGYAGVDDDGKVALPGAWPDAGVVIDGAPALPLTVADDTIPGAAAQDPAKVRTGEGTKVDTDNPPITDAKVKEAVEKNKLSLTIIDYFPFCIPFDLVKGVQLLQAPVEEPVFDIPIKVPYLGEQTVHIDLTQWDGVFVITRWFLLLGFVAGLALVTSKVIKW